MQRFEITSTIEGTPPANVTKGLSLCHIALDYSSTISASQRSAYRPRDSRTLPYRARCQARFRHSAGYRYRESPHGRPWRTSCRDLGQSQKRRPACGHGGSDTHPAGPRSSRGYAAACPAARRAACSRPQAWRRPRQHYSWSITSRQASMGRPADLSSWSALRSISSATTRMASDVARCRLQPAITRPTSTAENVSPVPGK